MSNLEEFRIGDAIGGVIGGIEAVRTPVIVGVEGAVPAVSSVGSAAGEAKGAMRDVNSCRFLGLRCPNRLQVRTDYRNHRAYAISRISSTSASSSLVNSS
jgi:hypothetical protein